MKRDIEEIIEIPEGIELSLNNFEIIVKSKGKESKKAFVLPNTIKIVKDNKILKLIAKNSTKRESKLIGTTVAHIENMINGMNEEFEYKLEICNVHFPMNVKVEGNRMIIKNFLGEKVDRIAKILPGVKVEVKGNKVDITSHNREAAGQTAANVETATKVRGRDRRIFQDGIFLTEKCGRKI
ncbi:MAG: 50S ribosomal protein L6 [Nanoarchaeota archaeon]|nr:50S ribosomal protein L6 [Nanoarchaeota archaeon]